MYLFSFHRLDIAELSCKVALSGMNGSSPSEAPPLDGDDVPLCEQVLEQEKWGEESAIKDNEIGINGDNFFSAVTRSNGVGGGQEQGGGKKKGKKKGAAKRRKSQEREAAAPASKKPKKVPVQTVDEAEEIANYEENHDAEESDNSVTYEPTAPLGKAEVGSEEAGRERFQWMIYPEKVDKFFRDSFEKRPLHIKRGQKNYYKDVFSTKEFDTILRRQRVYFGKNLDVTSYSAEEGRETHNPLGRAHPPVVWDFYNNGCSLRMINPQTFSEGVWRECAALQEFLGSMVGANAYLTPPGTQGFAPHYDDVEVFILQLEGKKRWRLYEPRNKQEELPRFSSPNFAQSEIGAPCLDVVLEAGDMLYFPRGTIHQGQCFEDAHSLHVTISCHQLNTYGDLLERLLPAALKTALDEDVEFRRGLPIDYLSYTGEAKRPDSTSSGKDKEAKRERFLQEVQRLAAKVFDYASVDSACDLMGKKLMRDMLPPCLSQREAARTVEGNGEKWCAGKNKVINRVEIDPDTEVRLIRANCIRIITEGDTVKIYYSVENTREYHEVEEQFLEIDSELAPAVEALARAYPTFVRAEELPLAELDEKMQVVQDLWEKGIVMTRQPLEAHYDD